MSGGHFVPGFFHRIVAVTLVTGVSLLLAGPGHAREKQPSQVSDLRYGVSLYDYFQRDYLAALSELQVADVRGGIVGHGDRPLMLKGAMSLAFGMDRTGTQIFERALQDAGSEDMRNAAWFYMGRMRYRRGDWAAAKASLSNIQGQVEPRLAEEVQAMAINLAIRTDNLAQAESALEGPVEDGAWGPYIYYNLGAAHLRADQPGRGIDFMDRLAKMELSDEEHLAIQDKGLTAAGYSLLKQGEYADAVQRFSLVRLDSPVAEQALLGYGWAAAEAGDYGQALGPWQVLAGRSPRRAAVQEALLAVPYAYEKLGSAGAALQEFEVAETIFTAEIARIETLKSGLVPEDILSAVHFEDGLVAVAGKPRQLSTSRVTPWDLVPVRSGGAAFNAGLDRAGLDRLGADSGPRLSPAVVGGNSGQVRDGRRVIDPRFAGLVELLSGARFQLYKRDIRDLDALGRRLGYWQENIGIYRAMLQHREGRREQILAQMEKANYPAMLQNLSEQREQLAGQLSRASAGDAELAIADDDTRRLWSRIQRAQQALTRLHDAGQEVAGEQHRLDRYRGMVLWQASEQFHEWQWQAGKRLRQLDKALADAETAARRLQGVVIEVPDIAPYKLRLDALERRMELQIAATEKSFKATESALRRMVVDELNEQQARLRHYQSQARLAKARLYDRAQREASR